LRILCVAVGRGRRGPEADLAGHYLDRARKAGKAVALRPIDLLEIAESGCAGAQERRSLEAEALLGAVPSGAQLVALDERGELVTSEAFATDLARWRDGGIPVAAFLVGGPDGHAEVVRSRADRLIAFGRVTWPHLLVRALLLEQIYRAATILAGHPYHRA
jgi:23S rRNA (pseudouridine1915-N3)-methyltransferase